MIPWNPRRFILILIGLFILNWVIVMLVAPPAKRIQIPYNPNFLNQVRAGHVKEISSSGDTVQGEFTQDVTYKGETAKRFETEFPTPGSYRLFLQFKHAGEVHTAAFTREVTD